MHIIYSTKVDNWINDYNRRIVLREEYADFLALMRRIIISLVLSGKEAANQRIEKIVSYTERNAYFECYERWLRRHRLYTVPFDRIVAVLIGTEIMIPNGENLTGYALEYDDGFYVLVNDTEEIETTISILTHEIMHAELESYFRQFEKDKGTEIPEAAKEELVVILEHTFLLDALKIKASDIQMEKVQLFQNLMQSGTESAIALFLSEAGTS
nr:hypothetical protein [uncultured Acetatifactor sp.]